MNNKIYLLAISLCMFTQVNAQNSKRLFFGRVISYDNRKPIANATIFSLKSKTKTISNLNGDFSIDLAAFSDSLIVSHLNYPDIKVYVDGKTPQPFVMSLQTSERLLQEVAITLNTGFQSIAKERATGSFVQIDEKTYNQQIGTNAIERLRYITNGVSPIADRIGAFDKGQMLIRGLSTFTISVQKPLIILDNFEYQGSLDNINPNDIENVTFLKDAAAGSIWGAKAANGVIVITTKKGKFNQRVNISMNANSSIVDKPNLFYERNISSNDLIDYEQFLFSQKYRFADTSRSNHPPFSPVYEILFKQQKGVLSSDQASSQLNNLRNWDVRNDFNHFLYQKAINQQYAVGLNGGSENLAWMFSVGLDRNSGNLNEKYNRLTLRSSNVYKVFDKLSISTDVFFTNSNNKSGRPAYGNIKPNNGALPMYSHLSDEKGNPLPLYIQYREGYIDNLGAGKLLDWRYYPLDDYEHSFTNGSIQDINATIGLNYKIITGLNIDLKYRYQKQNTNGKTEFDPLSYYNRDLINSFSQINQSTGAVTYKIPKGSILDIANSNLYAQNLRGQINYNKEWSKHEISLLAGSEISETKVENTKNRSYGYDPETLGFANVDYANTYPYFIQGGNNFIPNGKGFGKTNNRFASFYTNGAYTFDEKYTLSASARRDASNLFGVNTNDKWKPLWSTGASWNVTREGFFRTTFFNNLKIRGSYGKQGNIDPNKVAVTTFAYAATNPYTLTQWSQIVNYPNPDLKWEQVSMLNLGIDFSILNNRVSGSLEYYHKRMNDLYGSVPIDRTTGIGLGSITKNVGKAKGNGIDIQIRTVNTIGQLKWNSDIIFNTYYDKVTKLNEPPVLGSGAISSGITLIQDYSTYGLFAYKWAGLDPLTGDPQGYLDGAISKNYNDIRNQTQFSDIKYIGSQIPRIYGSLGNTFNWKNLALTFRVTYKFDYYFRRESIDYTSLTAQLKGHADYAKRWQKQGDEKVTDVPSFIFPAVAARDEFYRSSEVLVSKGDHIRLQYVNLSYELNKKQIKNLPFSRIQLYGVASNLGIIWKANKDGIDPDYSKIPDPQSYAFGIKLIY
ncbi:MAG: SusC/RagA family TonB-linked outer membrane protein [Candidatus Pedobacter colombiensis]|uniref:SusC/RagA family TonB-linked outer membrane protein n=1 Tax=Candidatus Pedobacter colombiensis TaxID=3121371 RepID=A0AAJ5W4F4_9SPHI|nr:SusC/RagA family TonB-linked outer membrane protein [Pedobacter sp.]WEK17874.1 MAG: SusC/RagA family TonB-linked outer membrane protein [Pedobacter sp.]